MDNKNKKIQFVMDAKAYKIILSGPKQTTTKHKKVTAVLQNDIWRVEEKTQTQVFHKNLTQQEMTSYLQNRLETDFTQLSGFSEQKQFSLRISKKGKLLFTSSSHSTTNQPRQQHNRIKQGILQEGSFIPPLVDMGIFTKEGKVVQQMYAKYRQINRFVELIDDAVKQLEHKKLHIIDFGCGKSYLTFILYHYFTQIKEIEVRMVGLDLKQDVVENCNNTAKKYGYSGLSFQVGDISAYQAQHPVNIVISLHACDTATDHALLHGIRWNADMIFSVPCCQHQLNSQIKSDNFPIITRYGLVQERFSALMTDAIRANLLQVCGYKTQLVEFVDFEHTPKNILIRAVKSNPTNTLRKKALDEVEKLKDEFGFSPELYTLLKNQGKLHLDKTPAKTSKIK